MGKEKNSNIAYYLFFFVFLFSCKKEKVVPPTSNLSHPLTCPDSKALRTHVVQLRGNFTADAQTIVPKGETPFPITLNAADLQKLNEGVENILCRVLERRGIRVGSIVPKGEHGLPVLTIEIGPGLKLKSKTVEFHIPPAEKSPELLVNFEHSVDRLLESQIQ